MKKILIIIVGILTVTACGDLTLKDINPKVASVVQAQTLFANGQKGLMDWLCDASVNRNVYRLIMQQWTETTYIDESNYDITTRTIPDGQWNYLYRDILKDLKEARTVVGQGPDATVPEAVQANQRAMIEITEVLAWSIIVQTWGDIPYTEALDYNKLTPAFDDGATVVAALIVKLDGALAALDDTQGGFDGGSDLLFDSDVNAWKAFGNSIKLRLGIMMADADDAGAKVIVEQAAPLAISSNAQNAIFHYHDAPPNTNQVWVNLVQSGRNDFVIADTFVDFLEGLGDPRRPKYYTAIDDADHYLGGLNGSNNNFASFSHVADAILAPTFEGIMMDLAEVEFYKAEAVERGYNVGGGTAEVHYNAAVTASMEYWGVDSGDITTYLGQANVAYTTATGTWQQKIGEQAWIAFYNRGFEAWVEQRRLDFPILLPPPDAKTGFPVRFTYPINEQNLNTANWNTTSAKIGGDLVTTKLFWDKF